MKFGWNRPGGYRGNVVWIMYIYCKSLIHMDLPLYSFADTVHIPLPHPPGLTTVFQLEQSCYASGLNNRFVLDYQFYNKYSRTIINSIERIITQKHSPAHVWNYLFHGTVNELSNSTSIYPAYFWLTSCLSHTAMKFWTSSICRNQEFSIYIDINRTFWHFPLSLFEKLPLVNLDRITSLDGSTRYPPLLELNVQYWNNCWLPIIDLIHLQRRTSLILEKTSLICDLGWDFWGFFVVRNVSSSRASACHLILLRQ